MLSNRPLAFIDDMIRQIGSHHPGSVIYRGENDGYPKVSSSLYRDPTTQSALARFDIQTLELVELENASLHAPKDIDYDHLRALLQHYHGKTNAIDFTADIYIALFFACHGKYERNGRIICLYRDSTSCDVYEPQEPAPRVTAQKSIFVLPQAGYIPRDEYLELTVEADMKLPLLAHLHQYHAISIGTIYNDILGYIHYRNNDENQTMARNAEALDLIDCGQYAAAIEMLSISIDRNPGTESTYQLRASAYQQAGYPTKAIEDCNQALRLIQLNPPVYALRALCRHEINQLDAGLQDATIAIQQDPEFSIAYNTRGLLLADKGNEDEALADFSEAVTLDPDFAIAYNNRGFILQQQGKLDDAIREFDIAISLQSDLAIAYLNLGITLAKLNLVDEARKNIKMATELDSNLENVVASNQDFIQFR